MTKRAQLATRLLLPASAIAILVVLVVAAISWSARHDASQSEAAATVKLLEEGLFQAFVAIALGLAAILITWWISPPPSGNESAGGDQTDHESAHRGR